jgi:thimet oligopeptidase
MTLTPSQIAEERTTIPIFDAPRLHQAATAAIEEARRRLRDMEAIPFDQITPELLDRWDDVSILIEDTFGPIALLNNVHTEREVRDAADIEMVNEASFMTEVFQNEALYRRIRAVQPVSIAQRQLKKDLLEAFDDSGVSLPPDKRARFKEISERVTELGQEFARNIRDNTTRLRFTPAECAGLPQSYLDRVERDAEGNILVGFDYPEYVPFMANAHDPAARKRYYIANNNRGTSRNLEVLDEIVKLRREIADLYEVPSFAHYVTRRRMVENPETVHRFLDEVRNVVMEAELRDLAQLAELKAKRNGTPAGATHIERWEMGYYRERLREQRFSIDQEELRKYFPTAATIRWMLDISERLFDIRFDEVAVPVWHEDVRYFDVRDRATGDFIGGVYLDLYPREGKYKHAAAWPVRGVSRRAGRKPISAFVTNFDRTGLTHDEVETLLHEFGHVLHGVLSSTEYNQHSGTSVERDFVEAPSQMFEEWASRMESLALVREHCGDCPGMDESLVQRLNAARKFGSGLEYGRQLIYACFDMALSGANPRPAIEVWKEMELQSPMGHVEGTEFPGTFEHIASGYAAGYYGYMWAKVIALDLVSAFGRDLMNGETGRRFREVILARGSEEPARDIVERFLGRPVSSESFFSHIRGE